MSGRQAGNNTHTDIPDRPCCIDECCSRDGFDDGPIVAVESVAVVVGDVAPVVGDDAREDVAAGGDEQTTPPIQNSAQRENSIRNVWFYFTSNLSTSLKVNFRQNV